MLTEHRHVPAGAIQVIAANPAFASRQPQGAELDLAMINAGLEPMPVPQSPRIVVLWEQASAAALPQPVAVLIDASEPMLRSRLLPREEISQDNPPTRRWKMLDEIWLNLVADSGNGASISSTLWAPGKQRAWWCWPLTRAISASSSACRKKPRPQPIWMARRQQIALL